MIYNLLGSSGPPHCFLVNYMEQRIESLKRQYESKIIESDENIKLLLNNPMVLSDHSDINKEIDRWLSIKDSNYSKLQHLLNYLPKEEKKDGS